MDLKIEFEKIMATDEMIALATSVDGKANVRVVNFYYDPEAKIVYFTSFNKNPKVAELEQNNVVAFTTIPNQGTAHARAQGAKVVLSDKSVYDVEAGFVSKIPHYAQTIAMAGPNLNLYEIHFDEVKVTVDMQNSGIIQL
ncbi:pyridoxamine 5'-phosphate oxidase family protein [Culicoidibacter larvae]|uniref:Pyridoxamine 5'-phosphate oxidase family protein n=1 Tax=Culicoidibacter larvae TaxID=2579976 RepID=A0A5R8QDF0_9FIRM|nr:pyridoxamine 5'-phosphate oxidase family protein [Culicoidibacter larvae]TLG75287.1 pyridoxamine 5'-phosphate oxidase family protein [Culicoidibacter larvae]